VCFPTRSPLPILDNILFELKGNELSFSYEVSFGGNTMLIQVKAIVTGEKAGGREQKLEDEVRREENCSFPVEAPAWTWTWHPACR
jgi:hypothetical protein